MNKVTKRKSSKNQKPKITPGVYKAKILTVEEPTGFRPGSALDVVYAVKCDPNIIEHRERFSLTSRSDRLFNLDQLLDAIGSEVYEDLIGATVELTFYYELKSGHKFCNVTDRKLLKEGDEDDIDRT